MKKIILSAALLICGSAFAQKDTSYNRLSYDFGIGAANVLSPAPTKGFGASFVDPISLNFGIRKMYSKNVGLALVLNYNNFTFRDVAKDTKLSNHYVSGTLQAYVNLTNALNFSEFTDKFGLLLHTGGGLSLNKGKGKDIAINLVLGFTPQYHVNNKLALNLDFAANTSLLQQMTLDLQSKSNAVGFSHYFGTATIGASYYFVGADKAKTHADWSPKGDETKKELEALRSKLNATEAKLVDTDNDGVANFLDAEPNTPAGSMVNAKGQAIVDMDGDGIVDSEDFCPTVKGTAEFKGCPMAFAQETKTVVTSEVAGTELTGDLKTKVAAISKDVNFDTKSTAVKGAFKKELDALAKTMNENTSLIVALHGHCDNVGEDVLNNKLSEERAASVRDYLVSKGVSASRISTRGFGIAQPKMSNDTEKGRAVNRRVELIVKSK